MDIIGANTDNRRSSHHGLIMKFLFDLLPVILFFTAFKYGEGHKEAALSWLSPLPGAETIGLDQAPILLATMVVMVATLVQIVWVRWRHGKVDKMLWISLVLVVFFGSLTLFFHDEAFIKWKPTVLYWILASTLAFTKWVLGKNPMGSLLGEQIVLPSEVWHKVNVAWIGFFTVMGFVNLYVAQNFPTETWVNFKLFGAMGLMFLFIIGQGFYLSKFIEEPK